MELADDGIDAETVSKTTSRLTPKEARVWARTGALAALALVLSYIESFIPLPAPIPGARLGLANIAILAALDLQGLRSGLAVATIKVLVTGILFGSPVMIPFSAAGTLLALAASWLVLRIPKIHIMFAAIAGALMHIVGQLLVATLMLGTTLVWYSLPFLSLIALFTGALTGTIAARLIADLSAESPQQEGETNTRIALNANAGAPNEHFATDRHPIRITTYAASSAGPIVIQSFVEQHGRVALLVLLIFTLVVICVKNLVVLSFCAAIALAFALLARVKLTALAKGLLPLIPILAITAIAQVLYQQQGSIVWHLGSIAITTQAIQNVCAMFLTMLALMTAILSLVKLVPSSQIMSAFSTALKPLQRYGLHVDAFLLSFEVALEFTFILVNEFKDLKASKSSEDPSFDEGSFWYRLKSYRKMFPVLARNAFQRADGVADRFVEGSYRASVS